MEEITNKKRKKINKIETCLTKNHKKDQQKTTFVINIKLDPRMFLNTSCQCHFEISAVSTHNEYKYTIYKDE